MRPYRRPAGVRDDGGVIPTSTPAPTSRRRRTGLLAAAVLVGATVLAGCATDDPDAGGAPALRTSPAAPTPSTPAASPSAAEATPEVPEGFSTQERRSPSWPRLGPRVGTGTEVRVGRHATYDRVVYEFSGTGLPTYRILYVDEPVDQTTGEQVQVEGDAYLSVNVTTVEVPAEDQDRPADVPASSLEGTVVASAPAIWGGFEGYGEQFIGIRGEQRPFRVLVLENPTRLVVDIAR